MTQQIDIIEQIRTLLHEGSREQAYELLASLLPADKATLFEDLDSEMQQRLLNAVDADHAADILEELDDDEAAVHAERLDFTTLTDVLDEMEPDEAADLLGDLSPYLRAQALEGMAEPDQVRPLLRYPDDSAGGLMTSDYYVFPQTMRVGQVFRQIREQPSHDEEIPYVYAVDEDGRLTGIAELADLIRAHAEQPLSAITKADIISIAPLEDQETAAQLLNRYDLLAVPVLDDAGHLLGVITADDAIAAQEEEASEDIYMAAGIVSPGIQEAARSDLLVRGPVWRAWWVRIPFLVLTMVGGMLAGAVVDIYEQALEAVIVLAIFIPVVMDMGGNAGAQSTEIFIRGHALGQIDTRRFAQHLLREVAVGLGMGAILGAFAGLIAAVWQGMPEIGLVVGLALVLTMALATILGFVIPYLMIKFGIDPAAGANPFITTIQDVTGLLIYFGLASFFMGHLL